MAQAQDGNTVSVHYRGMLDGGEEFDSSEGQEPLTFILGRGQVIDGFEHAVRGLEVGGRVSVRMEADQAYGPHDPQLVFEVPSTGAPDSLAPGDQVQLDNGATAIVTAISAETIQIDANHPLAGQALTFHIELIAIA